MTKQAEVKAIGKYIRISPSKVRRVINQIRGRSYEEALMILEFMPYRACQAVWQVLNSAAANAQHNLGFAKEDLHIQTIVADQGPCERRLRPRAQGKGYPIKKQSCHITVILAKKNQLA